MSKFKLPALDDSKLVEELFTKPKKSNLKKYKKVILERSEEVQKLLHEDPQKYKKAKVFLDSIGTKEANELKRSLAFIYHFGDV